MVEARLALDFKREVREDERALKLEAIKRKPYQVRRTSPSSR